MHVMIGKYSQARRDSFRRVKCVLENFKGWDSESWLGRIFKHGPVLGLMPWIAMASSKKIPKLLLTFLKLKESSIFFKISSSFFPYKATPKYIRRPPILSRMKTTPKTSNKEFLPNSFTLPAKYVMVSPPRELLDIYSTTFII